MLVKKLIRYKIIEKHMEWVRVGKLVEARDLLILLRLGSIRLGLGDTSYEVESFLETIGLVPKYSRNFNIAIFRL